MLFALGTLIQQHDEEYVDEEDGVYNGDSVRLGAENVNGEAFVTFDTDLTGAKELDKNTEYGQLQALIEAVGGVNVVVNFLIVNVFFQLGFYFLLQLQTN